MKATGLTFLLSIFSILLWAQSDVVLVSPQHGSELSDEPIFTWTATGTNFTSYQVVIFSCSNESSLDLSTYSVESNVPSGSCEFSGLALSPVDSASFITIDNAGAFSEILDDNGGDHGGLQFTGLSASDLEGISYLYDDYYVMVEEDLGSVVYFEYDYSIPEQLYTASDVWVEYIPSVASNAFGMEGVSYDPASSKIYAVKEKNPMTILEWDLPSFSSGNTSITGLNNPFDLESKAQSEYFITDVAGLFHLNQSADLLGTETGSHLLILSQESKVVLEVDMQGNEISRLDIPTINQAEGIAFKEGKIYIVSEANGGQECSFAVYSSPTYEAPKPNPANAVTAASTSSLNFQFPSGTFSAGEHYCWQVIGQDSQGNLIESNVFSFDMSAEGCTDSGACNYDPDALYDDGSCEYLSCADCEGVVNGTALPGTSCDDNDATTINDIWNSSCQCIGSSMTQGCTDTNACNYDPAAQYDNGTCEYISCLDCEGVLNGTATPGTDCDDNNLLTANDTWNSDCECIGVVLNQGCTDPTACNYNPNAQFDNGSCEFVSCLDCEGVLNGTATIGSTCDDGIATTTNDTWSSSCECIGIPLSQGCTDPSACNYNPSAQFDNGSCEFISCLDCEGVPNGNATLGTPCDDGNLATVNDSWNSSCICMGIPLTQGCTDPTACNYNPNAQFDNGSCEFTSCLDCEGVPNGGATLGTTCDDGNPATINDSWNSSCLCTGVPLTQGCIDPLACNFNPTSQFDDGSCEYLSCLDCLGVPNGNATLGASCDDGNPATVNDTWNNSCNCIGIALSQGCTDSFACNYSANAQIDDGSCEYLSCLDCEGVLNGNATLGMPCDDGDFLTTNDIWNSSCECIGVPVSQGCTDPLACNYSENAEYNDGSCEYLSCLDCLGIVNGTALPGTPCDDDDNTTVNDNYSANCDCVGIPIVVGCTDPLACNYDPMAFIDIGTCEFESCLDCLGTMNGDILPGTPCDDADMNTINDQYNSECDCEGEMLLLGCTDISACNFEPMANMENGTCQYIGETCDDNDVYTINDSLNVNCECIGEIFNTIPIVESSYSLYPNPVNDILNIILSESQNIQFNIVSIKGQLVSTEELNGGDFYQVDLSSLAEGAYFYEIINQNEKQTGSLLILR